MEENNGLRNHSQRAQQTFSFPQWHGSGLQNCYTEITIHPLPPSPAEIFVYWGYPSLFSPLNIRCVGQITSLVHSSLNLRNHPRNLICSWNWFVWQDAIHQAWMMLKWGVIMWVLRKREVYFECRRDMNRWGLEGRLVFSYLGSPHYSMFLGIHTPV